MLRALARRQQEQTQTVLGKPPQFDPAVYGASQMNWASSGDLNLPGSEPSYDYIESSPAGPSGRSQSSPYTLPASEISLARRVMQSSGGPGYEQSLRGTVPYGQQPITPSMQSPTSQQLTSPNSAQQKILTFQQQMNQQRASDMQFPYY